MSSYLVPFFFRFARSLCLHISLTLSLSLSISLSLSFLLWAACLVELQDEEEGELQRKATEVATLFNDGT